MTVIKKLSHVLGPLRFEELKGSSKSHRLFLQLSLTHFINGMSALSPVLVRSLRKLETIVRDKMEELSALEILLPTLLHSDLLKKSGRIDLPDLFKLENTGKNFLALSPTSEETVSELMSCVHKLNNKQLPVRLYQISKKFRDERRAKFGLLRSKEFIMKDLYCFDESEEARENTYQEVISKYHEFFKLLKVPYMSVSGSQGDIGGLKSEEFHFLSDMGEDELLICENCGHKENSECQEGTEVCHKCNSKNIKIIRGIEVAHAFSLGTRYTLPLGALFEVNNEKKPLEMSSFGLGLTRILAASVEVLATEKEIRWPLAFAPYLVCVIPPKEGSVEEQSARNVHELIYNNLNEVLNGDVVLDDRSTLTIGKRLYSIQKMGFPFVVIVGKNISQSTPMVEIIDVNAGTKDLVQIPDVSQFILNKLCGSSENIRRECSV